MILRWAPKGLEEETTNIGTGRWASLDEGAERGNGENHGEDRRELHFFPLDMMSKKSRASWCLFVVVVVSVTLTLSEISDEIGNPNRRFVEGSDRG